MIARLISAGIVLLTGTRFLSFGCFSFGANAQADKVFIIKIIKTIDFILMRLFYDNDIKSNIYYHYYNFNNKVKCIVYDSLSFINFIF
ncbi:hypothetical protein GGR08_000066 [Bartonella fuyuanensis]|uniref:Uncharacterized protein n=1 Tax=Bartonella fuyuanensis TaxID=1460968 RepID=A0A840DW49_9HYPH|nr:hypothetical protein [Bartonella fuyuanensis]